MDKEHHRPLEERQANVVRLRKIIGQLNGVEKMLNEDLDCSAILTQLVSARRGLKSLSEKLIHGHLHHCVAEARDRKVATQKLAELLTVLERYVE